MYSTLVYVSMVIIIIAQTTIALKCLETRGRNSTKLLEPKLCSTAATLNKHGHSAHFDKFALREEEDSLEAFEQVFQTSMEPFYEVLSLCVLEKYMLGEEPEILLRCVCKSDNCNQGNNLHSFIKHQVRLHKHTDH